MRIIGLSVTIAVTVFACLELPVRAHENHALVVMTGTVISADKLRIEVDTLDPTTFARKKLSVSLNEKTRYRIVNKRVDALTLAPGQAVELIVQSEDTADGSLRYKAIQVRIGEPKVR